MSFLYNNGTRVSVVGVSALVENKMSLKAKGLYSIMFYLANYSDDCSLSSLKQFTADSEKNIKASLKELENFGYIKKIYDHEFQRFDYQVAVEPINGGKQNGNI